MFMHQNVSVYCDKKVIIYYSIKSPNRFLINDLDFFYVRLESPLLNNSIDDILTLTKLLLFRKYRKFIKLLNYLVS